MNGAVINGLWIVRTKAREVMEPLILASSRRRFSASLHVELCHNCHTVRSLYGTSVVLFIVMAYDVGADKVRPPG